MLAKICGWQLEEERKVVMNRSRTLATLRCVVHVIPISACIIILAFNLRNYYIGAELAGALN
jgi:hypothetical protein